MDKVWREGHFVWRELMCPDVAKARAFYGALLGWTFTDAPMGDFVYTLIKNGEMMVGGMMPTGGAVQAPPSWGTYVSVADVDAVIKAAEANGGSLAMPAMDVPTVGRMALIVDPAGGHLWVMRSIEGDGPATERPPVGTFCWESLITTDAEKANAFYSAVIGWKAGDGPGKSRVFSAGAAQVADVGDAPPGVPSHWLSHVVVERLEPSRDKVEGLGGKVMMPLIEVPTIGRLAIVQDPFGATFSLFEPGPAPAA